MPPNRSLTFSSANHVSREHLASEHLAKYANEFAFRWNTRRDTDDRRLVKFIGWIQAKRLMYRHVSQPLCVC
jgi:hypothetical protein